MYGEKITFFLACESLNYNSTNEEKGNLQENMAQHTIRHCKIYGKEHLLKDEDTLQDAYNFVEISESDNCYNHKEQLKNYGFDLKNTLIPKFTIDTAHLCLYQNFKNYVNDTFVFCIDAIDNNAGQAASKYYDGNIYTDSFLNYSDLYSIFEKVIPNAIEKYTIEDINKGNFVQKRMGPSYLTKSGKIAIGMLNEVAKYFDRLSTYDSIFIIIFHIALRQMISMLITFNNLSVLNEFKDNIWKLFFKRHAIRMPKNNISNADKEKIAKHNNLSIKLKRLILSTIASKEKMIYRLHLGSNFTFIKDLFVDTLENWYQYIFLITYISIAKGLHPKILTLAISALWIYSAFKVEILSAIFTTKYLPFSYFSWRPSHICPWENIKENFIKFMNKKKKVISSHLREKAGNTYPIFEFNTKYNNQLLKFRAMPISLLPHICPSKINLIIHHLSGKSLSIQSIRKKDLGNLIYALQFPH